MVFFGEVHSGYVTETIVSRLPQYQHCLSPDLHDREMDDTDLPATPVSDASSNAAWFSWSYSKGRHTAFFFVDVEETKLGTENERKLQDFIDTHEEAKAIFSKRHAVMVTEVIKCSAFATIFIDAERGGHIFVVFNPIKPGSGSSTGGDTGQWTVRAPKGSYTPRWYDYNPS